MEKKTFQIFFKNTNYAYVYVKKINFLIFDVL